MKTVLVALRDIGSARMIGPIVPLLREEGINVISYLEGQAINSYPSLAGEEGTVVLADIDKALLTKDQFDEKISALFEPAYDAVIVGNSTPQGGETEIADTAAERSIPLIVMDDIGGGWKRMPRIQPSLIVTTIEEAAESPRREITNAR
jgi:hypothetical protein